MKKGDIILRLSNSDLDLQILNAESELAEKQNLLRNTQVTMQQDKLTNETEKVQLDIDTRRKQRTYRQTQEKTVAIYSCSGGMLQITIFRHTSIVFLKIATKFALGKQTR